MQVVRLGRPRVPTRPPNLTHSLGGKRLQFRWPQSRRSE
jgi:hypothetical protein